MELIKMQSLETAQSQAGYPISRGPSPNKAIKGRATESFLHLRILEGDSDKTCQCSEKVLLLI